MVKNNRRKFIAVIMALIMSSALVSCGSASGSASGDAWDYLSVVYEGMSNEEMQMYISDEEYIMVHNHVFVIENISDEDIKEAKILVDGLDENGEGVERSYSAHYTTLPHLRPGERAVYQCLDDEWVEPPASYKVELKGVVLGEGKGVPLTLTNSEKLTDYACAATIRNDGDEDFVWINDFSNPDINGKRYPVLVAVDKDADGNVKNIELGQMLDGDDLMFDNVTIAPGEEYTTDFVFSSEIGDPEIFIAWQR